MPCTIGTALPEGHENSVPHSNPFRQSGNLGRKAGDFHPVLTPGSMMKHMLSKDLAHPLHLEQTAFILHNTLTWSLTAPCELGVIPLLFTDEQTEGQGGEPTHEDCTAGRC